jgi:MoaA/NifB/PqqE/SkfB family radical SAM enzyme
MGNNNLETVNELEQNRGGFRDSESVRTEYSIKNLAQSQQIISGPKSLLIRLLIRSRIIWIIFRNYRSIPQSIQLLKNLLKFRQSALGENKVMKYARVDGKYYPGMYIPGFHSEIFDKFILGEVSRIVPLEKQIIPITSVLFSITKKCVLRCEHCFEWETLNGEESLTLNDIRAIVAKFQKHGVAQFHFSGGEPLQRIDDLLEVLKTIDRKTECWVLTSGHTLNAENAKRLKYAGLTGVVVSIDHFIPELHNQFRGSVKSFDWAIQAVLNAVSAKLVTAISICATNSFITKENLLAYADMAKRLGVSYIQIFEPRAVGHYKDRNVDLTLDKIKILENFYYTMNKSKEYRNYPIVLYHGIYQRRVGCLSAANRHIYVDADGYIRDCSFCRTKAGNALTGDIHQIIENIKSAGCPKLKSISI